MLLLIGTAGVLIIGLIVFGGGQVFIPLFQSLWRMMDQNGARIGEERIATIISLSNATPGVTSTKYAMITGYLAANGEWWGWLALFLTFLVFALPAILIIIFVSRKFEQYRENPYMKMAVKVLKPALLGILAALVIQLIIATVFPYIAFNDEAGYMAIKANDRTRFFSGWRQIVLYFFVPLAIITSLYMMHRKISIGVTLITHLAAAFIIFNPWL